MEDLDADGDAPEVTGKQTDVEEGGGGEAKQDGCKRVEEREDKRVSREVAANLGVPHGRVERRAVEDASLGAVDEHTPESQLADDFVQRALRHEELLKAVTEAVKGRTEQCEQVAFDLIGRWECVVAC